jgi:hypothetical protein
MVSHSNRSQTGTRVPNLDTAALDTAALDTAALDTAALEPHLAGYAAFGSRDGAQLQIVSSRVA